MGACLRIDSEKKDHNENQNDGKALKIQNKISKKLLELLVKAKTFQINLDTRITNKKGYKPTNNKAAIEVELQQGISSHKKIKSYPSLSKDQFSLDDQLNLLVKIQLSKLKVNQSKSFLIKNVVDYPYSAIGAMIFIQDKVNSESYGIGTGCIIGSKFVLTCAHNCYSLSSKKQYETIYFTPSPYYPQIIDKYKVKKISYPQKFKQSDLTSMNPQNDYVFLYDYAVLQLDTEENLEQKFGSLGFDFQWTRSLNFQILKDVLIVGYPQEIPFSQPLLKQLCGDIFIDNCIRHKMATKSGTSGSPIIEVVNNDYLIRGIHNSNTKNLTQDLQMAGILLSEDMCQNINKYIGNSTYFYSFNGLTSASEQLGNEGLLKFIQYINVKQPQFTEKLQKLYIVHNKIDHNGCIYLKNAAFNHLQHIVLTNNSIKTEGCKLIKEAQWKHLKILGLSGNSIQDQGCQHLSKADWAQLQQIWLSNNYIGPIGCSYIVNASWKKLNALVLDSNQLGDDGCQKLKDRQWTQLKALSLSNNSIGSQGCRKLKDCHWRKLQSIGLCLISLIQGTIKSIFQVLDIFPYQNQKYLVLYIYVRDWQLRGKQSEQIRLDRDKQIEVKGLDLNAVIIFMNLRIIIKFCQQFHISTFL